MSSSILIKLRVCSDKSINANGWLYSSNSHQGFSSYSWVYERSKFRTFTENVECILFAKYAGIIKLIVLAIWKLHNFFMMFVTKKVAYAT